MVGRQGDHQQAGEQPQALEPRRGQPAAVDHLGEGQQPEQGDAGGKRLDQGEGKDAQRGHQQEGDEGIARQAHDLVVGQQDQDQRIEGRRQRQQQAGTQANAPDPLAAELGQQQHAGQPRQQQAAAHQGGVEQFARQHHRIHQGPQRGEQQEDNAHGQHPVAQVVGMGVSEVQRMVAVAEGIADRGKVGAQLPAGAGGHEGRAGGGLAALWRGGWALVGWLWHDTATFQGPRGARGHWALCMGLCVRGFVHGVVVYR